jgi:glycosyltransferase involved in cell wall biosynthesis
MKLSIVVPCYNEEAAIPFFLSTVVPILENTGLSYEMVFVDDGSRDAIVATELDRLCNKGSPIAIKFKETLEISKFKPRLASEAPLPRPEPRRISLLQWGSPAKR